MDTPKEQSEVQNESVDSTRKGLTSDAIPDAKTSKEGQAKKQGCPPSVSSTNQESDVATLLLGAEDVPWYVLRVTYGKEKKVSEELKGEGVDVFLPQKVVHKQIHGKVKAVKESSMPNIFFAHAPKEELDQYVFDNYHFPDLRYYYKHYHNNEGKEIHEELVVPYKQMDSFIRICVYGEVNPNADTIVTNKVVQKFKKGDLVRVTDGPFVGVIGRVARYMGQQRVGVIVGGIFTVTTAFVPNRYLETVKE